MESIITSLLARWLMVASLLSSGDPSSAPELIRIDDLTDGVGLAYEARLAVNNPFDITVGWCIGAGEEAGVYLKRKRGLEWESAPVRIEAEGVVSPRDLTLLYDAFGRLHLAWTDLEGARRRVFYTILGIDGSPLGSPVLVNPDDKADADYPFIAHDPEVGAIIIWQGARATRFTIESALIADAGIAPLRLPAVSGESQTAMTPQVLTQSPPSVAWYEILDDSTELKVNRFDWIEVAWKPVDELWMGEIDDADRQPMIRFSESGEVTLCWSDLNESGSSGIRVARLIDQQLTAIIPIDEDSGELDQPQLANSNSPAAILAWQLFGGDGQSIEVGNIPAAEADAGIQTVQISPETHRFASSPSIAHWGRSTFVAWSDAYLDGGTGAVGFAQIIWP